MGKMGLEKSLQLNRFADSRSISKIKRHDNLPLTYYSIKIHYLSNKSL